MSTNGLNSDPNEALLNLRESKQQENTLLSPQYSSMSPDLGFHWANVTESSEDLNLSRIKEEISGNYYLKYTDLLSSFPPSSNDYSTFKIEPRNQECNDIGKRLSLKSLSHGDFYADSLSNGAINCGSGFSTQNFPTTNVSNLNLTGLTNPGSLDMNLQALDLLNSSRFSGNFNLTFPNQIGLLRDGFCYGIDYLQQSHQAPILYSSNKNISDSISNGAAAETKRTSNKMVAKSVQNAPKKLRSEARVSCPPFKVRKEKLGDRISALQQLVAPFGKTDTASVLMEAIGYIKFLQNQVETLSVPYMKSASRNKKSKATEGGTVGNENGESKRDLKTRGLCLVPLSFLSYITGNGGAPIWPPSVFGGATG
ncbi:transcription factor bHLH110 [Primulina tabacum]|uniref:transcription factor bHLH110 n=1 Tax=Primulina tabacum TaxID=48773 RepID=UPI003F594244